MRRRRRRTCCASRTSLDWDELSAQSHTFQPPGADAGRDATIDGSIVPPPRDDAGRLLGCGGNLPGPKLVIHKDFFGNATCIDSTEVTNAQYAQFLATSPTPSRAAPCGF